VNKTHGGSAGYGGPVAGPVFREVITEALRVLDVPETCPTGRRTSRKARWRIRTRRRPWMVPGPARPGRRRCASSGCSTSGSRVRSAVAAGASRRGNRGAESGPKAPNFIGLSDALGGYAGASAGFAGGAGRHRDRPHAGPAAWRGAAWRRKDSSRSCQMTLGEILSGVRLRAPLSPLLSQMDAQGLDYDSRRVQAGFLFFAFPGSRADGRSSRSMRLAAAPWRWPVRFPRRGFPAPWIEVEHGRQALALSARNFYHRPDERIAVTASPAPTAKPPHPT